MKKIAVSGIKPTGGLHIGNYLGMIKPALELAQTYQALYFIADYHALMTIKDPQILPQRDCSIGPMLTKPQLMKTKRPVNRGTPISMPDYTVIRC